MKHYICEIADKIIAGDQLSAEDALRLADCSGIDRLQLFVEATRIRDHFVGNTVHLCSIINAKSGRCPENCSFCAQSSHHSSQVQVYPLVDEEELVRCAKAAELNGAACYGIVTSGTRIGSGDELDRICRALARIRNETGISPSCSLGMLDDETANRLKEAGMETYHHNLETARSFFPQICSTHDYEEDVETIKAAKRNGIKVCSGGIFGLGENSSQRIEMAMTLRDLQVDSIPLNFLDPVPGTKLESANNLTPMECLTIVALYRFILPNRRLSVCGGREKNLRELQSWIFMAGANGMMTGNYLTKAGRSTEIDQQMLSDLGLRVEGCCGGEV